MKEPDFLFQGAVRRVEVVECDAKPVDGNTDNGVNVPNIVQLFLCLIRPNASLTALNTSSPWPSVARHKPFKTPSDVCVIGICLG